MSQDKKPVVNKRAKVESEIDVREVVVIDNGTDTVKIGMSGVDYPQIVIDTVAGTVEPNSESDAVPSRNTFFGELLREVLEEKKFQIKLTEPVEEAHIDDKHLEDMAELWRYALSELLGIELTNANVLVIDSCANKKDYKAKIAEVLMDKLKVKSLLIMNSSSLSLFSTGATTGFVAELGHGISTVVPVYEGFVLPHALQRSNLSGKLITHLLEQELQNEQLPPQCRKIAIAASNPLRHTEIVRHIKQKMCQIAYDYNQQLAGSDDRDEEHRSYELPDGKVIQLSKQTVFKPAEALFNPKLAGSDGMSLTDMMRDSLSRCDPELASEMKKNIVFCGGTSILRGFQQRLEKEFETEDDHYEFVFDWQRRYSAWIGGSMLGSLSTFQSLAITRDDYDNNENKAAIVFKKCF